MGERFWRVVGSVGEATGTVIGADIVGQVMNVGHRG